ncbi:unnamed protein product [Prorocentrum cordatum]|uniref:Uncharacterized protein n=1 Tax=Prorocentrum cordatum TaxID=2364126 RepID=A0ABN9PJJ4_9DINO|nr:unnamed protein product [Polarella glacialis]CAK0805563.1 unnamed protein product [Polarella glacialis]
MSLMNQQSVSSQEFRDVVLGAATKIMNDFHGPMQYLMHRYSDPESLNAYSKRLHQYLPPLDTCVYEMSFPFPVSTQQFCVHPGAMSFDPSYSPREPTRASTALALLDHVLTDGFITEGDPIILCSGTEDKIRSRGLEGVQAPWAVAGNDFPIPPFSIAQHKGNARIATMHFLLTLLIDDEVDLHAISPKIWNSLRAIKVRNVEFASLKEQTFDNFKLSARGAVRRQANVVSWVVLLSRQRDCGDTDAGAIIRSWNSGCTQKEKLMGNKAQTVKNIMHLGPPKTQELLIQHISKYDWDGGSLSEEALASKKVWPGSGFRTTHSKKWTQRQHITTESRHLMFQHCFHQFDTTNPLARRKFSKMDLEEFAEKAAVICAIRTEAVNAGMSAEQVDAAFVDKWRLGDPRVEMDLASALAEKRDEFTIRDITCLKEILDIALSGSGVADMDISLEDSS